MTEQESIYSRIKGVIDIYKGFDGSYFVIRINGKEYGGTIEEYEIPNDHKNIIIVGKGDIVEEGQLISYAI